MSFEVKFDPSSIDRVRENLKARVERVVNSDRVAKEIGETVVADIRRLAREGKSAKKGRAFKRLSTSWVKTRSYLAKQNKTSDVFQEDRKSRLSFTGKFLESMNFKKIKGGIAILFTGFHPGYSSGKKKTRSIQNEKLREYLEEDRPFIGLRKNIIKRINLIVLKELRRNLRG